MTYGELKAKLAQAELAGVSDYTEVYIGMYECLVFSVKDTNRELVIDVNDGEVFFRDVRFTTKII